MPQLNSSQVVRHIADNGSPKGAVFYCSGPTLSGRTYLCDAIEQVVKDQPSWTPKVHRHTGKQTDIGHELVTTALKSFEKNAGLTRRKLIGMAKKGLPGFLKATRAIASTYIPGIPSTLDGAIDKLATALNSTGDDRIKAFPVSNVNQLISLLREAVEDAGPSGVLLIVDSIEELPVPGILLINSLLQEAIPGLTLVLTSNSEASATHQAEHAELKARLQYKSPNTILEIVGHTAAEISEWKFLQSGVRISHAEAMAAHASSIQGRSGLLSAWAMAQDVSPAMIDLEHARLFGQLDLEYAAFSPTVRVAVAIMAQCFPDAVSLPELALQLGVSREEMLLVRDQLVSSFADDHGSGLQLRRRSVFDYILQRAGPAAISSSWHPSTTATLPNVAYGEKGMQMISYSTQHRLFAIQHDLKRGAVQSAFDRIDVTLKLGVDNAAKAELLYHLADVHDQRGEYAKALGNLSEAFDISHNAELQQNAKLQVATVQFRLGRTTESLRALHWVRKQAAAAGSTDGVFYAVLRSISVLIERDKPQAAKRIARAALDEREKMRPGPKVDCHFSRIAARALVLTEDSKDRAKTLALDAFGVAQRELGERALGNCQYCLGDVYRHRREYAEAESSYRSGLTHAVSNFDLKLYCYLGLAAVAIAKADDDGLRHCLEELSQLPISSHSPEWTIAYMFASIYLSLGHPLGPHVDGFLRDASYGPPSRLWQVKAAELLARRTQKNLSLMEFRRGLGELKIVL